MFEMIGYIGIGALAIVSIVGPRIIERRDRNARRRKIAAETEQAQRNKTVMTVALRGVNKPKLAKSMVSQKIGTLIKPMSVEFMIQMAVGG